ncbi:DUF1028 domain-containing protein [Phototrophicus methaneseepsis]|uniref:DUF1028 domain-containing protein n=1 Tax=Phototrophicus methaneseepsis TaxID=2710758 RepID=A0A7S8EAN4_9CHLR|nr:DUF1028 domain-containing protein [Phototrophicus methaneseepsis]QPC83456.1 DUF1028 domain-containing protein [Phototrophicus methaneseepsis]
MRASPYDWHSTYSIVAHDAETSQMGVAIQTHQIGFGHIVSWVQPGIGVIATQSLVNASFGPIGLSMLQEGMPANRVVDGLVAMDDGAHHRQISVVDATGNAAAWTGERCIREAAHYIGEGYSIQANMMADTKAITAMTDAFENANGTLAERMVEALNAAHAYDSRITERQSASIKVVSTKPGDRNWDTIYDLRVDDHEKPSVELARLVRIRHAWLVATEGYNLLKTDPQGALGKWKYARELAPEQEEIAFWQGVYLANSRAIPQAISIAGRIIAQALNDQPRREHWLDLIARLEESGVIEDSGTASELLAAIEAES